MLLQLQYLTIQRNNANQGHISSFRRVKLYINYEFHPIFPVVTNWSVPPTLPLPNLSLSDLSIFISITLLKSTFMLILLFSSMTLSLMTMGSPCFKTLIQIPPPINFKLSTQSPPLHSLRMSDQEFLSNSALTLKST
jgi:hypothetical protein